DAVRYPSDVLSLNYIDIIEPLTDKCFELSNHEVQDLVFDRGTAKKKIITIIINIICSFSILTYPLKTLEEQDRLFTSVTTTVRRRLPDQPPPRRTSVNHPPSSLTSQPRHTITTTSSTPTNRRRRTTSPQPPFAAAVLLQPQGRVKMCLRNKQSVTVSPPQQPPPPQ
ncbi:hypothetical protein M8C21_004089, partial [Ambrosia artemisiifolia]